MWVWPDRFLQVIVSACGIERVDRHAHCRTPHIAALGLQALTAPNPSFTSSPQPAFVALSVAVVLQFMSGSLIALRCCSGLEQTMKLNVIVLFPKSSNYAEVTCHYASVYRSVKINAKNLTAGLIDILNHHLLCSLVHIYTVFFFYSKWLYSYICGHLDHVPFRKDIYHTCLIIPINCAT